MKNFIKEHPAAFVILITMPFMLWGKMMILPTFDDWTTLSAPNTDPDFRKYLLPFGYVWRPFDAIMGYIVGIDYRLFPKLNHAVIFAGHIINVLLIYKICEKLGFSKAAKNIAAIYFYLSPCMLATVFSCDSLNQTYSQLWGLAAILAYLTFNGRKKYILWTLFILIAALAKDNGIAFAVIPPIIAFAVRKIDRKTLVRHFMFGIGIAMLYAIVRLSLPATHIDNPDYTTFVLERKLKEIAILIGYLWSATDYICLIHEPSRNLPVAFLTFATSFPFIYHLLFKNIRIWKERGFLLLAFCAITALSPNLLISLTIMNTYAGLSMVALLVGYATNKLNSKNRAFRMAFVMYLMTAVCVDIHHWYMSYKTSLAGKEMAVKAIERTGNPANKVYCITIKDDYPRFSSFCVVPGDAFGNGFAVAYETGYKWPEHINSIEIERKDSAQAEKFAKEALKKGYDCVWIVNRKDIKAIRNENNIYNNTLP